MPRRPQRSKGDNEPIVPKAKRGKTPFSYKICTRKKSLKICLLTDKLFEKMLM